MAFEDIEMKDIILATLAEIEDDVNEAENKKSVIDENLTIDIQDNSMSDFGSQGIQKAKETNPDKIFQWKEEEKKAKKNISHNEEIELANILSKLEDNVQNEDEFLSGMRERLVVLFEGLKTSSNHKLEKKLSLTMSYLEYTLAIIDERLDEKNKKTS